jgi:hypothetical protein
MFAVIVDGNVGEYQPLRWSNLAELAFHRIVIAVRPVHHDAQGAAHAHIERVDGTGEAARPKPLGHHLRVRPGFPNQVSRRIEDADQGDTGLSERSRF